MNKEEIASLLRTGVGGALRFARGLSACSRIVILVLALCPVSAMSSTPDPVTCFDQCEQSLASCRQAAQGNPILEARCQDIYDACCEGCLQFL